MKSSLFRQVFPKVRADLYALLGALLNQPPDHEVLMRLAGASWHLVVPEQLCAAGTELSRAADRTTTRTVEEEYLALFVGLGQGEVIPYASWYLEGRLMALSLARIRSDLDRIGVFRRPSASEPEDHAGLLCETMALLSAHPKLAARTYARFFNEYIASWMFEFFKDLQTAPNSNFFRFVGKMGALMLASEKRFQEVSASGRPFVRPGDPGEADLEFRARGAMPSESQSGGIS